MPELIILYVIFFKIISFYIVMSMLKSKKRNIFNSKKTQIKNRITSKNRSKRGGLFNLKKKKCSKRPQDKCVNDCFWDVDQITGTGECKQKTEKQKELEEKQVKDLKRDVDTAKFKNKIFYNASVLCYYKFVSKNRMSKPLFKELKSHQGLRLTNKSSNLTFTIPKQNDGWIKNFYYLFLSHEAWQKIFDKYRVRYSEKSEEEYEENADKVGNLYEVYCDFGLNKNEDYRIYMEYIVNMHGGRVNEPISQSFATFVDNIKNSDFGLKFWLNKAKQEYIKNFKIEESGLYKKSDQESRLILDKKKLREKKEYGDQGNVLIQKQYDPSRVTSSMKPEEYQAKLNEEKKKVKKIMGATDKYMKEKLDKLKDELESEDKLKTKADLRLFVTKINQEFKAIAEKALKLDNDYLGNTFYSNPFSEGRYTLEQMEQLKESGEIKEEELTKIVTALDETVEDNVTSAKESLTKKLQEMNNKIQLATLIEEIEKKKKSIPQIKLKNNGFYVSGEVEGDYDSKTVDIEYKYKQTLIGMPVKYTDWVFQSRSEIKDNKFNFILPLDKSDVSEFKVHFKFGEESIWSDVREINVRNVKYPTFEYSEDKTEIADSGVFVTLKLDSLSDDDIIKIKNKKYDSQ